MRQRAFLGSAWRFVIGVSLGSFVTTGLSAQINYTAIPAPQWWNVTDNLRNKVDDSVRSRPDPEVVRRLNRALSGDFTSSPQRTQKNLAEFVEKTRAQNPAGAADLERLLSSMDLIGEVGKAMQGYGLDPHNVADAYTVWWIAAWAVANGVDSPDDAATYQAVQMQARGALANTSNFANVTDADRQQLAETLMVQAVLLDSVNDDLRETDPATLKQIGANARKGAKDMGVDLDTMVLTREGFKPREGADASEVIGGEDAPALAVSEDADSSTPTYLAIAAAATLGLGGAFWLGKRSS